MHYPEFSMVGHRGAMAHAPENSVEAFVLAECVGALEIELDVRCTSDNELIVVHDDTLDRVVADDSGRNLGPIADLTSAEVRAVTLKSGFPALTLEEAFAATTVTIQVEVKERRSVGALADFMTRYPECAARSIFCSFDADALEELRELAPQIPRGVNVLSYPRSVDERAAIDVLIERTGSDIFHCNWIGLDKSIVDKMHAAGLGMRGWPVKSYDDMKRAVEFGVDGITTDDPELGWQWHERATREARG